MQIPLLPEEWHGRMGVELRLDVRFRLGEMEVHCNFSAALSGATV